LLGEGVVERGNEGSNRGVGFVAHIRDTERLPFEFTVAAVDDELVAGLQGLVEALEVGVAVVFEAIKSPGGEFLLRQEGEALAVTPSPDALIERR